MDTPLNRVNFPITQISEKYFFVFVLLLFWLIFYCSLLGQVFVILSKNLRVSKMLFSFLFIVFYCVVYLHKVKITVIFLNLKKIKQIKYVKCPLHLVEYVKTIRIIQNKIVNKWKMNQFRKQTIDLKCYCFKCRKQIHSRFMCLHIGLPCLI